jgi:hypothetical protein
VQSSSVQSRMLAGRCSTSGPESVIVSHEAALLKRSKRWGVLRLLQRAAPGATTRVSNLARWPVEEVCHAGLADGSSVCCTAPSVEKLFPAVLLEIRCSIVNVDRRFTEFARRFTVPYEQMYPWHGELTGGTRGDAMVLRMTVIANLQRGPNRWRRL